MPQHFFQLCAWWKSKLQNLKRLVSGLLLRDHRDNIATFSPQFSNLFTFLWEHTSGEVTFVRTWGTYQIINQCQSKHWFLSSYLWHKCITIYMCPGSCTFCFGFLKRQEARWRFSQNWIWVKFLINPIPGGVGKNYCATYSGHISVISSRIRVVSKANVKSTYWGSM